MSTAVKVLVNTGTVDSPYGGGGEFVEMDLVDDFLVFTNGSDVVKDGEPIPSDTHFIQAGVLVQSTPVVVPKYMLADDSVNLLKEIHNAGNQNKRYVFAFDFDGVTTSEPVLEVWDDSTMQTIENKSLGEETPSDSWVRGVVTTDGLPGVDWVGSALAGSSISHFLWLNNENGALTAAKTLYCNLKIVIPGYVSGSEPSGLDQNVYVVKYTTN